MRLGHEQFEAFERHSGDKPMNPTFRFSAAVLLAGASAIAATFGTPLAQAQTQDYPTRPVKMLVGFAAGGPTDVLARIVANGLSRSLGQQVIVDNRPGVGGVIANKEIARAPADGYNLVFAGDATLTVQPQVVPSAGYDPVKDFTPLRLVASQTNVLVTNTGKSLPDVTALLAKARKSPGTMTYGSAGSGSPSHLIGALFTARTGTELIHVPYKGAAPAFTDLIGGQIDAMFVGMPVALQNGKRSELKLIAITGAKRSRDLPNVPTFEELGISGLGAETAVWWAVMAPPRLPVEVAQRLDQALQATLQDPEVRKNLAAQGVDILDLDSKTTSQWIQRDSARWAELIRSKKVSIE
jgi:tripartite-type tricarboxylate transporter receptor subunit TctC